ncbi:hypothetical protein E2C01_033911 [Portunus trituberculatus]|uniref:Uncharacterized protein n=1 Tax=Portunus trituberculatus TaxID=210409 RepID=A0A5B7F406_PORTR|nr:hypothetical protein [Portunus trituberculatus]
MLCESFSLCITTQGDSHSLASKDNSPSSYKTTCTYHTHPSLEIKYEMSSGQTALSVVTKNILTPPSTFSLTSAIFSFTSIFQSVEHHLSSTKPHLLFLTETQLSE